MQAFTFRLLTILPVAGWLFLTCCGVASDEDLVPEPAAVATEVQHGIIESSIQHDNQRRNYILYVPEKYDGATSVPLLLNFHGYTSNAQEQMGYGDFRPIADTAGFIIVHPQGTLLNGSTHWNVGGWTLASTTDDVGFTDALIDSLGKEYNIDRKRIYSTGMSNGGYMSFLLACQLSNRIAAIASVTGSMTPQTFDNCDPARPVPVLQIHGTADPVVAYGGKIWTKPVDEVISYWVEVNQCDTDALVSALPDNNPQDGSTVERQLYQNGKGGAVTDHYKVLGGAHTWPGNSSNQPGTNRDFSAVEVIWAFLSRYDLDGLTE